MSVRLLAGPFDILDVKGVPLITVNGGTWYPHVGLVIDGTAATGEDDALGGLHLVTLDGVAAHITELMRHSWSWWPERKWMIRMTYVTRDMYDNLIERHVEEIMEPIAFTGQFTSPGDWLTSGEVAANLRTFRYVRLRDRRIYSGSGNKVWRQVDGVIPDVPESDPFPFVTDLDGMRAGRSETDVWLGGGNLDVTKGCFYDTATCKVSSPVYQIDPTIPSSLRAIGYATDYGVIFSIHHTDTTWQIRVWSLEVQPTILTAPTVLVGTPKSGQVVTYQVQVTGDQNDGAEGELVNWSLTGAGVLLQVQTKADADGYATTQVQYGIGETGTSTLEARVEC